MSMKLGKARIFLFFIWTGLFLAYVLMMLCTSFKRGVSPQQSSEAAWSVGYVLFPVLTAFASFWFLPRAFHQQAAGKAQDNRSVQPHQVYAMFTLTAVVHLIVVAYFAIFLFAPDWADEHRQSWTFDEALSAGLKMMVFFSSVAVLPVGWVLNPSDPVKIEVQGPNTGAGT
jgi:hypothetical protein